MERIMKAVQEVTIPLKNFGSSEISGQVMPKGR